jgi:hypothetical protein
LSSLAESIATSPSLTAVSSHNLMICPWPEQRYSRPVAKIFLKLQTQQEIQNFRPGCLGHD